MDEKTSRKISRIGIKFFNASSMGKYIRGRQFFYFLFLFILHFFFLQAKLTKGACKGMLLCGLKRCEVLESWEAGIDWSQGVRWSSCHSHSWWDPPPRPLQKVLLTPISEMVTGYGEVSLPHQGGFHLGHRKNLLDYPLCKHFADSLNTWTRPGARKWLFCL